MYFPLTSHLLPSILFDAFRVLMLMSALFSTPLLAKTNNTSSNNGLSPAFLSTATLAPLSNSTRPTPLPSPTAAATDSPLPSSSISPAPLSLKLPTPTPDSLSGTTFSLPSNNIFSTALTNLPATLKLETNAASYHDIELPKNNAPFSTKSLTKAGEQINSGVVAKNAPKLTIDDCIKTALQKNPTILQAIDTIRAQSGNYITVRAAMLPQFGLTNNSLEWTDPSLNNKANLPANQTPNNTTWGITLGATQLLYNGGTAIANAKAAKFSEQMAYYNLRVTINAVVAQVIAAFYQVVLNRALVVANQQSVEVLASNLADQKSRYEAGTVPRFNVLQAEVQLANVQPNLIAARNNLRIALFQLVQLIGMNYPNLQSVEVPFQVVGELEYHPRKIDSDDAIYVALQRSPILKAQRQNILLMAQNVTAALGGFLPTFNAVGGYQYLSYDGQLSQGANGPTVTYNHNLANFVSGWFFGVQGNWSIFDGLSTYGSVKQAKANLMYAKTNYDNQVREVILTVQQAISNMQQAKETVDSQKANVAQAAEALRLAQERLNAGAGVQLDVLNAQVQLLTAQSAVLQSEYNYISYTAQFDQALSLNTQFEELFDDPMNHRERVRFKKLDSSSYQQLPLPKSLRATDPLPAEFVQKKKTLLTTPSEKINPQEKEKMMEHIYQKTE